MKKITAILLVTVALLSAISVIAYAQPPAATGGQITYMVGDADGDNVVSILDATMIQRVLIGLEEDEDGAIAMRAACDGEQLGIMHATKIQRYIAGYKVAEPIGQYVTIDDPTEAPTSPPTQKPTKKSDELPFVPC